MLLDKLGCYISPSRDLILIPGACHVPSGPQMATKIIHFIVNGKVERAEFEADCTAEDVKGKREDFSYSPFIPFPTIMSHCLKNKCF